MHVHLWTMSSDVTDEELSGLDALLSDEERRRAMSYRSMLDRRRFVAGRGLLRRALAHHCGVAAGELQIVGDRHTKPRLVLPAGRHPWRFSFTRSGALTMCVVAEAREVGIDIEQVTAIPQLGDVAQTALSPSEHAYWRSFPARQRQRVFHDLWTRKEALGKAEGHGMTPGLHEVEVPALSVPLGGVHCFGRWTLTRVEPGPDHVGNLVVETVAGDAPFAEVTDTRESAGRKCRTFR